MTAAAATGLTPTECRSACEQAGFAYAAMQYGGQHCYCDNTYATPDPPFYRLPDSACSASCHALSASKRDATWCGGGWANAVYYTIVPPPSPPTSPDSGAIIELTGYQPKILFGDPGSPACELSLNRDESRLESTCAISTSRRRLNSESHEYELELKALKMDVEELRHKLNLLTSQANANAEE